MYSFPTKHGLSAEALAVVIATAAAAAAAASFFFTVRVLLCSATPYLTLSTYLQTKQHARHLDDRTITRKFRYRCPEIMPRLLRIHNRVVPRLFRRAIHRVDAIIMHHWPGPWPESRFAIERRVRRVRSIDQDARVVVKLIDMSWFLRVHCHARHRVDVDVVMMVIIVPPEIIFQTS